MTRVLWQYDQDATRILLQMLLKAPEDIAELVMRTMVLLQEVGQLTNWIPTMEELLAGFEPLQGFTACTPCTQIPIGTNATSVFRGDHISQSLTAEYKGINRLMYAQDAYITPVETAVASPASTTSRLSSATAVTEPSLLVSPLQSHNGNRALGYQCTITSNKPADDPLTVDPRMLERPARYPVHPERAFTPPNQVRNSPPLFSVNLQHHLNRTPKSVPGHNPNGPPAPYPSPEQDHNPVHYTPATPIPAAPAAAAQTKPYQHPSTTALPPTISPPGFTYPPLSALDELHLAHTTQTSQLALLLADTPGLLRRAHTFLEVLASKLFSHGTTAGQQTTAPLSPVSTVAGAENADEEWDMFMESDEVEARLEGLKTRILVVLGELGRGVEAHRRGKAGLVFNDKQAGPQGNGKVHSFGSRVNDQLAGRAAGGKRTVTEKAQVGAVFTRTVSPKVGGAVRDGKTNGGKKGRKRDRQEVELSEDMWIGVGGKRVKVG